MLPGQAFLAAVKGGARLGLVDLWAAGRHGITPDQPAWG
jgi:hypothetical protein